MNLISVQSKTNKTMKIYQQSMEKGRRFHLRSHEFICDLKTDTSKNGYTKKMRSFKTLEEAQEYTDGVFKTALSRYMFRKLKN